VATAAPPVVSIATCPDVSTAWSPASYFDLCEVDLVRAAEAGYGVGDGVADLGGVFELAARRGEMNPAAAGGFGVGEFERALVDLHAARKGVGGGVPQDDGN